jgi:hypothetical protein
MVAMPIPSKYKIAPEGTPSGQAYNVAQGYARAADALRGSGSFNVDFNLAVQRHTLIDAIERSSATGRSVKVDQTQPDVEDVYCFGGNPLDRASERRDDGDWIAKLLADPDTRLLPLRDLKPFTRGTTVPTVDWQPVTPWRDQIDGGAP